MSQWPGRGGLTPPPPPGLTIPGSCRLSSVPGGEPAQGPNHTTGQIAVVTAECHSTWLLPSFPLAGLGEMERRAEDICRKYIKKN